MSGGVFISYRREDSAGFAGRIYDRLTRRLDAKSVFLDVDNIEPGLDFFEVLSEKLRVCDALIAVIGKNWNSSADQDDRRRLDDPDDFVRIEIEAALERGIRVIPVLVDGATMPRREDLPESLQKLRRRQAIEISHNRFDSDVERLTQALALIEEELRQREARESERAAREEREEQKAADAAPAEEVRRKPEAAAAWRSEEERRARAAAEAERAAREERERREAAEAAARAERERQAAESARAAREERHDASFVPDQTATGPSDRTRRTLSGLGRGGPWGLRVTALVLGSAFVLLLAALVLRNLPPTAMTATEENEMGDRYFTGEGVEQDYAKAMEWYRKAADQGFADAEARVGYLYRNGLGVSRDIDQARVWYQKAADQGSVIAKDALKRLQSQPNPSDQTAPPSPPPVTAAQEQNLTPAEENEMGDRYFYGRGVEHDYARAMEWYRKAADQGFAEAQHTVGVLYENGWGVTKDIDQAKVWYQKAADQGNALARTALQRLGGAVASPTPNPTSPTPRALKPANTPQAQYEIGDEFFYGFGGITKPDEQLAATWYRKAADQGYSDAQFRLGSLYEHGYGVNRDIDQARIWYQKAADQGNAAAKDALQQLQPQQNSSLSPTPSPTPQEQSLTPAEDNERGDNYFYGRGVEQDYAKAMEWYRKAAERGSRDAQYNIGVLYRDGLGVPRDTGQARIWFQQAADRGDLAAGAVLRGLLDSPESTPEPTTPTAENEMGDRYFYGRGVNQDYGKALAWYRKAADQGYAEAQHNVGALYENGWGVAQDVEQAKVWYQKAAVQGDAFAKGALERLQEASTSLAASGTAPVDTIRLQRIGPPPPGTLLPGGQPAEIQLELTYVLSSADRAFLAVYAEEFKGAATGCNGGHRTNGAVTIPVVRGEHYASVKIPWRGSSESGFVSVGANFWKNADGHEAGLLKSFGLFPEICYPFGSSTPASDSTPNFAGDWIEANPKNPDHPFKLRIDQKGNEITVFGRPMQIVNGEATRTIPQGCGPQFQKPGYDYNGPNLAGPDTLTLSLADSGATLIYEIVVDWIAPCDGHAKGLERTEYRLRRS